MARKSASEGSGPAPKNHNLKKVEPHFKELAKAFEKMEADAGAHRSAIKTLYDKAASETGLPKRIIKEQFGEMRAQQKKIARQLEMSDSEREDTIACRDALKGTSFERFLDGKLATKMG